MLVAPNPAPSAFHCLAPVATDCRNKPFNSRGKRPCLLRRPSYYSVGEQAPSAFHCLVPVATGYRYKSFGSRVEKARPFHQLSYIFAGEQAPSAFHCLAPVARGSSHKLYCSMRKNRLIPQSILCLSPLIQRPPLFIV